MSDQGERDGLRAGEGDDWWNRLYDPGAQDSGRSPADDTIDDRFASAGEVGAVPRPEDADPAEPAGPGIVDPLPSAPAHRWPEEEPDRARRRSVRDVFGYGGRPPGPPFAAGPGRGPLAPPEPGVLTGSDPGALGELVPDTVLDGARHGALTLRAVSGRGGSARQRGEPRGDALLTVRFGTGPGALLFVAVAVGAGTAPAGRRAAREVCQSIGEAVGRSRPRLSEDMAADRRATLANGLKRLTDRCYGRLRAQAAALGARPDQYTAGLRCLLLPADPDCRLRVSFGSGGGGLFRLRAGQWTDLEPEERSTASSASTASTASSEDSGPPVAPPFRFRAVTAEPGDALLLCSTGLAVPLRGDPTFADTLASRWSGRAGPPGLASFLTAVQDPAPAYGDDRTAAAVWEGGTAGR